MSEVRRLLALIGRELKKMSDDECEEALDEIDDWLADRRDDLEAGLDTDDSEWEVEDDSED
jgi:hypothetical protein